jgi:hypothetical protein
MPATSLLEQYRVADFLEWHERKQLVLNPHFQRRSVWSPLAKAALVDTILRRFPIPKLYMRTKIDPDSRRAIREVVDGQQRLRAIIEFAQDDGFALGSRCGDFSGARYSTMSDEMKEAFLTYPIAVDQLVNATDADVLEVFARLNSYTATLVPAEKRHAKYHGPFKLAVHDAARKAENLWSLNVLSTRERVRMADDSLMAELFGVILKGVTDGGADKIERLYKEFNESFPSETATRATVEEDIAFTVTNFGDTVRGTPLGGAPHFLMLFAAVAHARHGIPVGKVGAEMPARDGGDIANIAAARDGVAQLASIMEAPEPPDHHRDFWIASKGTTHRIAGRKIRFLALFDAVTA